MDTKDPRLLEELFAFNFSVRPNGSADFQKSYGGSCRDGRSVCRSTGSTAGGLNERKARTKFSNEKSTLLHSSGITKHLKTDKISQYTKIEVPNRQERTIERRTANRNAIALAGAA